EERGPEIAEGREVAGGRERQSVPCVFIRAIAARGDPREKGDEDRSDREHERKPFRPEDRRERRRTRPCDVGVDPVLLEDPRREANVFGRAVGQRERARDQGGRADRRPGRDRPPPSRRHIKKEEVEGQELEPDGGREEDARREGPRPQTPGGESEGERDEVHVPEGHFEDEGQEEDVAGRSPGPPGGREWAYEGDADRRGDRNLQRGTEREDGVVGQERERNEE